MPTLTVEVPNLISGVSQQPDSLRFPSQAEAQVNAYSSVVDGLIKRHPMEHVGKLYDDGTEEDEFVSFPFQGTNGQDYFMLVFRKKVRVFRTDGTEVPVYTTGFGADIDPDFTYLASRAPNELEEPETMDLASNDWAKAGTDTLDPTVSGVQRGPYGFKGGILVGTGGTASDPAEYLNDATFDGDEITWFSGFFHAASTNVADSFQLELEDTIGTTKTWTASFTISGGVITDDGTTTSGAVSGVTDEGDGWYRCWIGVDPDDAANSGVIASSGLDALQYVLRVQDTSTFPDKTMFAWGMMLATGSTLPDYFADQANIQSVTVQDTTFLANPGTPVRMSSDLTDADTDDGHAFFFIRQGSFKTSYIVDIAASGLGLTTVQTDTWDGTTAVGSEISSVKTEDIANDLAGKLNALGGVTASNVGPVIRVQYANPFTTLEATDSQGNTAMVKVHKSVADFEDLPLVCRGGFRVKVESSPATEADDYYVEFVADGGGSVFGEGHWIESTPFEIPFQFDETTMPYKLTRSFDNKFGTLTGTPDQEYFQYVSGDWEDRLAGDETSNPDPSFVSTDDEDRFINDIFFFKGRLGFLTGENVVLSEANRFFSFFRTSVRTLVDSDPIDISASSTRSSAFHTALPLNERLIVFSGLSQSIVESSGGVLTPQSAAITPVLQYENLVVHPFTTGRGIYFPYGKGSFSGVREMFAVGEGQFYDTDDTTKQVPRYIPGEIEEVVGTALENVVIVRGDADRSRLYVHKFFLQGNEKIQSAWFEYRFNPGIEVRSMFFFNNVFFAVVKRAEGVFLEKMTIADGLVDEDADFLIHLDRRISDQTTGVTATYDAGNDVTELTLPYDIESGDTMQVVTRQTPTDNGGIILQIDSIDDSTPGAHTITVNGDHSSTPVWIGASYLMSYQFSDAALKVPTDRGSVSTVEGRFQIRFGNINFDTTAYFEVKVTPIGGSSYTYKFSGLVVGSPGLIANELALETGRFRFPVASRNTDVVVVVENPSPVPCRLLNAEWLGTYNTRFAR